MAINPIYLNNNKKYPIHTEIKTDDILLTKISLDQKSANECKVTLFLDGYEKYSEWFGAAKDYKNGLVKSGGYSEDSIWVAEKGEIQVTFTKNTDVKEFVEYIAGGAVFDCNISVREKNILLDALKMDAEVPPSLLIEHCENLYTWKVDEILRKGLEDANTPINKQGNHPIHIAYLKKSHYLTETLLKRGADIDLKNDEGKTALGMAVEDGDRYWVKYLVGKGADDTVKIDGKNLLQIATKCFLNADNLYHSTGNYDYWSKKWDYQQIAKEIAHKHKDWINLSNEAENSPIYSAHEAHDQGLYNALLSEANDASASSAWWWF